MIVSGRVHKRRLLVLEYLQAENRLLRARLSGKRIHFTDTARSACEVSAKAVGRKAMLALETVVSSDTLMRWYRRLVAQKWDFSKRRGPGRLGVMREISELIVRMAPQNPGWGYTRIQGTLANLSHHVGRVKESNVLKCNGIISRVCDTARRRRIASHYELATDSLHLALDYPLPSSPVDGVVTEIRGHRNGIARSCHKVTSAAERASPMPRFIPSCPRRGSSW